MNSDSEDRAKIRCSLNQCIHPLKIESHASNLHVNICTGEESSSFTNVNKASQLGSVQMQEFPDLPDSFRKNTVYKSSIDDFNKRQKEKEKI